MDFFSKIEQFLKDRGYPSYRLQQLYTNIFQNKLSDFELMSDIPKILRAELKEEFNSVLDITGAEIKKDTEIEKVLLEFKDGARVEAVNMLHREDAKTWSSLCISSQVGCALDVNFVLQEQSDLKEI